MHDTECVAAQVLVLPFLSHAFISRWGLNDEYFTPPPPLSLSQFYAAQDAIQKSIVPANFHLRKLFVESATTCL